MNKKAFTFIEMLFVLLIMIVLAFFLYNLFTKANKISSKAGSIVELYEQQYNVYRTLKDDLANTILSANNEVLLAEIKKNNSGSSSGNKTFEELLWSYDFNFQTKTLTFFAKKKDVLLNNGMENTDTGLYKINYAWVAGEGFKRSVYKVNPAALPLSNKSIDDCAGAWNVLVSETVLLLEDGSDIQANFKVENFDMAVASDNRKIVLVFDTVCDGRKMRFKEVVNV